jgi:hypothetical protein
VFFQASYSKARFRAVSLRDLADPDSSPATLTLDNARGSNFKNIAVGWVAPHRKIVYASPATTVLYGFVKFLFEVGRATAPSVEANERLIFALEESLKSDGVSQEDLDYYLRVFRHGIFFHYGHLGALTNSLMLEAFRRLVPGRHEPFVLAATDTLAYGVGTGASALFLDSIFWPRTRMDGSVAMEVMEPAFAMNYRGRVSAPAGPAAPLTLINWPMWKGYERSDGPQFAGRKNKLLGLFEGDAVTSVGPFDAHHYLDFTRALDSVWAYPVPLQELFLQGLHHAAALNNGGDVKLSDILAFLENTLSINDFLTRDPERNRKDLTSRMAEYYTFASGLFSGRIVGPAGPGGQDGWTAGEALPQILLKKVDPLSLRDLESFIEEFPDDSDWRGPGLFGTMAVIVISLTKCMHRHFPRAFHLPSIVRGEELEAARMDSVNAHVFFRERSQSFTSLLESMGISQLAAREMALKIQGIVNRVVQDSLARHYRFSQDPKLFTVVRDSLVEYVFPLVEKLIRWLNNEDLSSLQETMCPGDSEIGEKRADFPFDRQYRQKYLDVLECFINIEEYLGEYPLSTLDSLNQIKRQLAERLSSELLPSGIETLDRLITEPLSEV